MKEVFLRAKTNDELRHIAKELEANSKAKNMSSGQLVNLLLNFSYKDLINACNSNK